MKEGYRYRVNINGGDHVGMGGGYAVYINGKLLIENDKCTGRGGGEKPKGAYITKEGAEQQSQDLKSRGISVQVMSR